MVCNMSDDAWKRVDSLYCAHLLGDLVVVDILWVGKVIWRGVARLLVSGDGR